MFRVADTSNLPAASLGGRGTPAEGSDVFQNFPALSEVTTVGACCFVVSQPVKTNDFQLTCRNVDNNNKSLSSDRSLSRSWMAPTSQPTGRSADGVFGSARVVVFRRAHPLSAFMSVVEIYGHERLELSGTP